LGPSRQEASIVLRGPFVLEVEGRDLSASGELQAVCRAGAVALSDGQGAELASGPRLLLRPTKPQARFVLKGVTVGVAFHWQHEEDLVFGGELSIEARGDSLDVVNQVPLEEYLVSVISSEMSARCPEEMLRAHAVISRSWLLAQLASRAPGGTGVRPGAQGELEELGELLRLVRWYDREDHEHYDVCADDHCQRYQGVTRANTRQAVQAVAATRGLALCHQGQVCDARFSKCCGGFTERFSAAWGDGDPAYLQAFPDLSPDQAPDYALPLCHEPQAAAFIAGAPPAFCNTADRALLERVLPELDHATRDFYRWETSVSQQQLQGWLREKLDLDLGPVLALLPLERGASGRITRLELLGPRRRLQLGKELEIRRVLSDTHLYSSAFIVLPQGDEGGAPARFLLRGAGWGHGVGLCQIGAAVMAERGYDCQQILAHYYRGAQLERIY